MGTTIQALAEQNRLLKQVAKKQRGIQAQVDYIARVAGISKQVAAVRKKAEGENPANSQPEPASEAPAVTTEEARGNPTDDVTSPGGTSETDTSPDGKADLETPGATPVTDVSADATQDVTAPTEGTTEMRPREETTTESDVQTLEDPDNSSFTEPAFASKDPQARFMAAQRLARLRIAAGIEDEDSDDLVLASRLVNSEMTDDQMRHDIETLGKVVEARQSESKQASRRPRHLVPQAPSGARQTPSLAGATASLSPSMPTSVEPDELLFE